MSDRTASAASQAAADHDKKAMSQAIVEREKTVPLKEVSRLSSVFSNDDFMKRLQQAVPKQLGANRMLRSLVGSVQRSPDLLKCGILDVVGKMLVCASAGLETDTPLGHAHLIPFKKRTFNRQTRQWEEGFVCQVIFGYHGLLDLSYRTGMLGTVNARCVWKEEYEKGVFSFEFGTQRHLRHRPLGGSHDLSPEAQAAGRADWPMFVYAHATLKDGFADPFEVMPWSDVTDIRDRAQAYSAAKRALEKGQEGKDKYVPSTWTEAPWVRHVRAMANKTVFRQLSNWLPRTIEIAAINAIEEGQERGNMNFAPVIDGAVFRDDGTADYLSAGSEAASDGSGESFGMRDGEADDPGPGSDGGAGSGGGGTTTTTTGRGTSKAASGGASTAAKAAAKSADQSAPTDSAALKTATDAGAARWQAGGGGGTAADAGKAAAPTAPAEPTAEPFQHWALDEIGEPVEEHDGLPLESPAKFAEWFESAAAKTTNINGLREQNMDAIGDAGADPEAAQRITDAIQQAEFRLAPIPPGEQNESAGEPAQEAGEAGQGGEQQAPEPMPVPSTPGGKPHWPHYRAQLKDVAANIGTVAELDAWVAVQRAATGDKAIWSGIDADIATRRAELSPPPPKRDQDSVWAESAVGEIRAMSARPQITEWGKGAPKTKMARLKEERPELFKMVDDAVNARWAELPAA